MLLATHLMGKTTWHDATEMNTTDALDELWEWGKEELTTEELTNRFLLAKNDMEQTVWHVAAKVRNS